MKKAFIFIGICSVIAACASPEERAERQNTPAQNQSATAQQSSADTNATKIGTDNTNTTAGTGTNSGDAAGTNSGTNSAASAGSERGKALIEKSDCLTCHKDDVRIIGPAYKEVADKYPANDATYTMLAGKIIKGGAGNWGEIPMTPHPDLSQADAKEMAKYVMSLKSK